MQQGRVPNEICWGRVEANKVNEGGLDMNDRKDSKEVRRMTSKILITGRPN